MADTNESNLESATSDEQNPGVKVGDLLTNPAYSGVFQKDKQPSVIVCGVGLEADSTVALHLEFSAIPEFANQLPGRIIENPIPRLGLSGECPEPPAAPRPLAGFEPGLLPETTSRASDPPGGSYRPLESPEPSSGATATSSRPAGGGLSGAGSGGRFAGSGGGELGALRPRRVTVESVIEQWGIQTHENPAEALQELMRSLQRKGLSARAPISGPGAPIAPPPPTKRR
ncbi:MAG: hypothetical protein K2W95_34335 [Candidatus Obscuribacterales bacterium]|nr:hypothetical protein [Candidatus Obscuribacterales bacterium]